MLKFGFDLPRLNPNQLLYDSAVQILKHWDYVRIEPKYYRLYTVQEAINRLMLDLSKYAGMMQSSYRSKH